MIVVDVKEDVEVVEVGRPGGATGLDLNKLIKVDIYKIIIRKSPRQNIIIEQTSTQKLTPRTKATQCPNILA